MCSLYIHFFVENKTYSNSLVNLVFDNHLAVSSWLKLHKDATYYGG